LDLPEFSSRLKDALYPAVYAAGALAGAEPFTLLLWHVNWVALLRNALAVLPLEPVERGVLGAARRGVSRYMMTVPYLFQVGLYLVVPGLMPDWLPIVSDVEPDHTGSHSVIVQAIHFVDLETGRNRVNRSQWAPNRFGGTLSVSEVVNSVLWPDRPDRGNSEAL
jgi:hypothetical protein